MALEPLLFWILAAVIGATALGVVFSQNIVRTAIWLLASLVGISLLYFLLSAEFVGATQLIIYVGGTMVLVVFAVMLTAQQAFVKLKPKPTEMAVAGIVAAGMFALVFSAIVKRPEPAATPPAHPAGIGQLGMGFMGLGKENYLFPFEIVSMHLLVALIAAAYLARARRREGDKP